jgi:MerR family transcriptional regulator, mercuric resistance operon regulatory protein
MQNLTIGRLAEATGVHVETIRYYERIGLIRKPERTPGGHRSYAMRDLERLRFIRCSRDLGFGLDAIRTLLQLSQCEQGVCSQVRALTQEHLAAVERKLAELTWMNVALTRMLAACPPDPLPSDPCPILKRMSAGRSEGSR